MSRRKLWIWVWGVVIAAGVLAVVRSRTPVEEVDLLWVRPYSRNPVTNGLVKITKLYRVPMVSSLRFLPRSWFSSTRQFRCPDGSFQVPRVYKRGLLERVEVMLSENGANWRSGPVFSSVDSPASSFKGQRIQVVALDPRPKNRAEAPAELDNLDRTQRYQQRVLDGLESGRGMPVPSAVTLDHLK